MLIIVLGDKSCFECHKIFIAYWCGNIYKFGMLKARFSHIAYVLMKVRPENLNLNSAYITAQTDKECEAWKQGLKFLIEEAVNAPYPLQIERWLRKEFYAIENSNEKLVF